VSYARATTTTAQNFLTNLYSGDATLRWKPLRRAIYNSFLFRTELFWARVTGRAAVPTLFQTQTCFWHVLLREYRVNRRWTVGGRFDRSGHATDARLTDTGFSGILTIGRANLVRSVGSTASVIWRPVHPISQMPMKFFSSFFL